MINLPIEPYYCLSYRGGTLGRLHGSDAGIPRQREIRFVARGFIALTQDCSGCNNCLQPSRTKSFCQIFRTRLSAEAKSNIELNAGTVEFTSLRLFLQLPEYLKATARIIACKRTTSSRDVREKPLRSRNDNRRKVSARPIPISHLVPVSTLRCVQSPTAKRTGKDIHSSKRCLFRCSSFSAALRLKSVDGIASRSYVSRQGRERGRD